MSRFFAQSSDSDSSSSDDETFQEKQQKSASSRIFMMSDDEVESAKRPVRSAKEKTWDGLQNSITVMKNARKIRDLVKLLDEFDSLTKQYIKSKTVIAKEGIPSFYVENLVETEDFINQVWEDKEGRKKMSKVNSKSLGSMRQKLRRYIRDFEEEMKNFRENKTEKKPEESAVAEKEVSDEESDESNNEEEKDMLASPKISEKPLKVVDFAADDDDDDSDEVWPSDSESSSDESEDGGTGRHLTAEYFLKPHFRIGASEEGDNKGKRRERLQREGKKKDEDDGWEKVKTHSKGKSAETELFKKDTEINHKNVLAKLQEILQNRGRRSTDKQNQVVLFKELRNISEKHELGIGISIKIVFCIISGLFDYNTKTRACMKPEPWKEVVSYVKEALEILSTSENLLVTDNIVDESENVTDSTIEYRVKGNIVAYVEKLESEYMKILQNADAHSTEYLHHLKDENEIVNIIKSLCSYTEAKAVTEDICVAYLLRISHLYYKFDYKHHNIKEGEENNAEKVQNDLEVPNGDDDVDSMKKMSELCEYIYTKDSSDRIRTRAILYHIYHHALHGRWYEARDLVLMSHLQESVHFSDVPTQIIYNRTMVQLGLCAFRQGFMQEAHNCLVDIQSSGRAKELLAQGILMQRQNDRMTPEQEKLEKGRQVPFHMHINLELLECVYLVSAMLLEIPYIAAHEFESRRRMISKQFHHQLRVSERQALLGPPDNMREHVVAAAKAMKMGDYKNCILYIINEKMNNKVWNLFSEADEVRTMLTEKIKEESLRTYLFTYSQFYNSMSLKWLSELFELDGNACHRIISKMIFGEELAASWDEPSSSLVLHRTDPTRLQNMAMQLSDKVSTLVEMNERILESKSGFQPYNRQDQGNQGRREGNYYQNNKNYNYRRGNQQNRGWNNQNQGGYRRNNNQNQGGFRSGFQRSNRGFMD